MKIWIVEGTTGEYSDRHDWVVCAYQSQEKAEEHVRSAMLRAKEIQKEGSYNYWDKNRVKNEFDPKMQMDYTGTEYYTVECELKQGAPQCPRCGSYKLSCRDGHVWEVPDVK